MHVTKWGEYGILCSVFLARRYLSAAEGLTSNGLPPSALPLSHACEVPLATNPDNQTSLPSQPASLPVGALEVAHEQGIPAQYTQQILQRLRRGGIVKSVRGAHGGYVLSRPPSKITLLDIMKAAEGSTFDVMCETSPAYPGSGETKECIGGNTGAQGKCNLKGVWLEVRAAVDEVLKRKTLEALATENNALQNGLVQIATSSTRNLDLESAPRSLS